VIVAHVQTGIEIIHLYSGRPVCRLMLGPGALYTDINGDAIIDTVRVALQKPLPDTPISCLAEVTTGVPAIE